jgi:hypothetical protein
LTRAATAGQFSSRHVDNGRLQIADPALFDAEPAQAVAGQGMFCY